MGSLKILRSERWILSSEAVLPSGQSAAPAPSLKIGNNESMDSGIAGIRDGCHAGSPVSATVSSGSSSSSIQQQQQQHKKIQQHIQQQQDLNELPQYIVDKGTRTTYLKGKFLGKGGFARVHELTDMTTGKIYAGKIIPKSRITKPHHREKIAREIELHRNLIHNNVVCFFHCFEDDENVYIILENCSRRSLVHVMRHRKTLTEPEVRYCLRQLADGLRYIHASGIVHRDLKLGNMFLSEDMIVKIGDFGLAARLDAQAKVTICGTPNYIAPEVLSRQGHGYEADLWAVGCIMYAMLVGQPPFETCSLSETYARIAQNKYTIPASVSRPARSLIRQLLSPDPRQRPTLEQVLHHEFLNTGLIPAVLPASCCTKAPNFAEDNDIMLNCDHVRSNSNQLKVPVISSQSANRSRPESLKLQTSQGKDRVGRSHSLKESQHKKDREKEKMKDKDLLALPVTLKQKLTSALCPDRDRDHLVANKILVNVPAAHSLYSALDSCLFHAPTASSNPVPVSGSPLFVSKWIDYSNKYGFGFQLSDRSVGVLFNDNTRINFSPDKTRVNFHDSQKKATSHGVSSIPSCLMERVTLLRYFSQYMDENLTEGGDTGQDSQQQRSGLVHMKRWVRTPKAIIMQLDNNTLQINFFKDHTKVVLSSDATPTPCNLSHYFVTYINSERQSSTFRLLDIARGGCESTLRERLVYALTVLREFAELDGEK